MYIYMYIYIIVCMYIRIRAHTHTCVCVPHIFSRSVFATITGHNNLHMCRCLSHQ